MPSSGNSSLWTNMMILRTEVEEILELFAVQSERKGLEGSKKIGRCSGIIDFTRMELPLCLTMSGEEK